MDPHSLRDPARAAGDRLLGALGAGVGLACMVAVLYVVHPALSHNPVHLPFESALRPAVLAPEGWAFFTRDPREARMFVFARDGGGWRSALLAPHGQPHNLMGWNRKSRAQGVEAALLVDGTSREAWRPCEGRLDACLDALGPGMATRNRSPRPTLCGTVAVVYRPPVPWAWLPQRDRVQMPSRILPLEVSC
jgi:antimicrobial peptide system SdpA family protein